MLRLNVSENRSNPLILWAALAFLLAGAAARGQSIFKWVDAQGQTHYSDHAPMGQETEAVLIHVARPSVPVASVAASSSTVSGGTSPASTTAHDAAAARDVEQKRRMAEQQEAAEAAKAKADEDVVAKCQRARDIYCNEGADAIRQHEKALAEIQYADAITARQERVSRGLPAGPMPQPPP